MDVGFQFSLVGRYKKFNEILMIQYFSSSSFDIEVLFPHFLGSANQSVLWNCTLDIYNKLFIVEYRQVFTNRCTLKNLDSNIYFKILSKFRTKINSKPNKFTFLTYVLRDMFYNSISKIEHIYHYITSIPISLLLIASH